MYTSFASLLLRLACAAACCGIGSVAAAEGHIRFAGVVMEPTCAVAPAAPADQAIVQRLACRQTAAGGGRTYTRQLLALAAANPHHDRLLDYFASYAPVAADGVPAARLVLRTYD